MMIKIYKEEEKIRNNSGCYSDQIEEEKTPLVSEANPIEEEKTPLVFFWSVSLPWENKVNKHLHRSQNV